MAKKKELTPEEKLQQALVPKEEQPYPLPEGWKWVRLGDINTYKNVSMSPQQDKNQLFELYSVPSSAENYPEIVYGKQIKSNKQIVKKDDVLLCKINPRINRVWKIYQYTDNPQIASSEWIVIRSQNIFSDYLMWCFRAPYFRNYMTSNVSGVGGSLMRARLQFVKDYPVPIPPVERQKQIVKYIEYLFAKLDMAQEKVEAVTASSEKRKAAILHKAFTGELTAKWREGNNISFETWRVMSFNEVAVIKSNLVDPKDYQNYPHIAPDNIEKKTGKLLEYHSVREDKVKSNKHRFYSGQILYSKIRPYLSKVVMVDFDGLCSADMYPIEAVECAKYLWYYMLSDIFLQQASTAGSRSVLPKINQKELSKIKTPMPSRQEQEKIVYILDHLFAKEEIIAQQIQKISNIIQILKKSILGKAFRGNIT